VDRVRGVAGGDAVIVGWGRGPRYQDWINRTRPPTPEAIRELEDAVHQAVMRASRAGVPPEDIVKTLTGIADQAEGGV
jgi:hypothetical protein